MRCHYLIVVNLFSGQLVKSLQKNIPFDQPTMRPLFDHRMMHPPPNHPSMGSAPINLNVFPPGNQNLGPPQVNQNWPPQYPNMCPLELINRLQPPPKHFIILPQPHNYPPLLPPSNNINTSLPPPQKNIYLSTLNPFGSFPTAYSVLPSPPQVQGLFVLIIHKLHYSYIINKSFG